MTKQEIPEETQYHWEITLPDGQTYVNSGREIQYDFPKPGRYAVSVTGTYSAGSFSKEKEVTAECELSRSCFVSPVWQDIRTYDCMDTSETQMVFTS